MKLDKNLREFIGLLNTHSVEFLVVGGHAVAFHGHPRFTGDIDFFVAINAATADKLLIVLEAFGFASLGLTKADFLQPDAVIQLGYPPNRIDIVTGINAVTFDDAWSKRISGDLDGLPVQYISRDLLIRNKLAAGRPKDLADAHAIDGTPGQP
ncbi:MAG TPA: DUF6036 family nucleotidyltransferase [Phycisphaerae bacterium]|jgi:hypothetical protein